jgi:hypothetical protein
MKKVTYISLVFGLMFSTTSTFAFQPKETAKYFNGPTISAVTSTSATVSLSEAVLADITTEEKAGVYFEYYETNKVCIAIYPTPTECLPKKTVLGQTNVVLSSLKPNTSYTVLYKRDNTIMCITTPCPGNGFESLSVVFVTASTTGSGTTTPSGGDVTVPTPPEVTPVVPVIENTETLRTNNLTYIKSRGALLIRARVNSLNENARIFAASKNLTGDQKTAFAAYFADQIAQLNALNVKIQAGADASSTKPLVASIFTDFRIYGIVIPQVRLEKRIYELQNHSTKLTSDTFPKIQAAIDAAKAQGKDVISWQKSFDDAKVVVASDTAKLPVLLMQIAALKPVNYGTTSRSAIISVNNEVRMIARDFESIRIKMRRPVVMKYFENRYKQHEIDVHASGTATSTWGMR